MSETPWAEPVGEGLFRLDNLPWYAYGVSDDDIVEAEPSDMEGMFEFVRVRTPSGNRVVRVIFDTDEDGTPVLEALRTLGCHWEGATKRFLVVSIPPAADFDAVCSLLTQSEVQWEHANPTYEDLYGPQRQDER